jgi:8-oxo-dGTP pyrophosphatase MutT (NUDIX family)
MMSGMPEGDASESLSCTVVRNRLRKLGGRRSDRLPPRTVPSHFRRAAVLMLIGCRDGRPFLVLSERAAHMRAHASEVCMPGGRVELNETDEIAAVRETVEELGVDPTLVEVLGRFDEAWSGAGNVVTPVVAWYAGSPDDLRPNSEEVARILVADLAHLTAPAARRVDAIEHGGHHFRNDVIDAGGFEIYGLTADLVLDLLAWIVGSDRRRVPQRAGDLEHFFGGERSSTAES